MLGSRLVGHAGDQYLIRLLQRRPVRLLDRRLELILFAHSKSIFPLVDLRCRLDFLRLLLTMLGCCSLDNSNLFVLFLFGRSFLCLLFLVLLLRLLFGFLLGLRCRRSRSSFLHGQLLVKFLALQVEFGLGVVHVKHLDFRLHLRLDFGC